MYVRPVVIQHDLHEILGIEEENNTKPWKESMFRTFLSNPLNRGLVVEYDTMVIAFGLCQLVPDERLLILTDVSVDQDYLRMGAGSSIVNAAMLMAKKANMSKLSCYVIETNVEAQLFLRSCGLRWVKSHGDYYDDGNELDVYEMERWVGSAAPVKLKAID